MPPLTLVSPSSVLASRRVRTSWGVASSGSTQTTQMLVSTLLTNEWVVLRILTNERPILPDHEVTLPNPVNGVGHHGGMLVILPYPVHLSVVVIIQTSDWS